MARRADPLLLYRCFYRARVVAQSADHLRVDVIPEGEDGLLPPMSNVPLRHGIPGLTVDVGGGAYVLVGWENGKPDRPFAGLWANPSSKDAGDAGGPDAQGGGVNSVVLNAAVIRLGGSTLTLLPSINGVVTGEAIDAFTGLKQWQLGNASQHVLAKK